MLCCSACSSKKFTNARKKEEGLRACDGSVDVRPNRPFSLSDPAHSLQLVFVFQLFQLDVREVPDFRQETASCPGIETSRRDSARSRQNSIGCGSESQPREL